MPILIAFLIAITISGAYLFLHFQIKGVKKSGPISLDDKTDEAKKKIDEAISKAQEILEETEQKQSKILEQTQHQAEEFETHLEEDFAKNASSVKTLFESEIKDFSDKISQAEASYLKYLDDLKKASLAVQEKSLETVKQQVGELFLRFEQNLSDFLAQTEQKSTQSIELEIQATRHLIDSYKTQQLKVIDENIIAMLERTLTLVLTKKLNVTDQTELIYESLEQAKAEKFIV